VPGQMKTPGPDHPITVRPSGTRVTVRAGGRVIVDTTEALALQESTYPVAYYVPLAAVDPAVLRRTATSTYCPYKGDASYYSVVTPDGEITDAIWTYEEPYPAVKEIAGHVAFYPDKVEIGVG
jgi:uncharacterized protein (DUF427 family)